MTLTGTTRGHLAEIEGMMQCTSECVREAAGRKSVASILLDRTTCLHFASDTSNILHLQKAGLGLPRCCLSLSETCWCNVVFQAQIEGEDRDGYVHPGLLVLVSSDISDHL